MSALLTKFNNANTPEESQTYFLAFPSNEFGGQDPWVDEEIHRYIDQDEYKKEWPRGLVLMKKSIVTGFGPETNPVFRWLKETGADVFSLDWRTDMKTARRVLGDAPVQGNLDPMALFAPPEEIRRRVHRVIRDAGPRGHVFNLGHGVLPTTPLEGVQAMVDAVKSFRY